MCDRLIFCYLLSLALSIASGLARYHIELPRSLESFRNLEILAVIGTEISTQREGNLEIRQIGS